MSKNFMFHLNLMYIAPDGAVDQNGKPVTTYNRSVPLDKEKFVDVNRQMQNGKKNIVMEHKVKIGKDEFTCIDFIHLDNPQLILANTSVFERMTEEEAKELQKAGSTVLFDAEGNPIAPKVSN